jgi:hypothetical protein
MVTNLGNISTGGGSGGSGGSSWSLTGNAGTNPATDFIGTTDEQPFKFGVFSVNVGILDASQNVGFGQGLYANLTTGTENFAINTSALSALTEGANNLGIGQSAGETITTGSSNICIGTSADVSDATGSNAVAIGSGAVADPDAIAFGNSATATTGQFALPDATITEIKAAGVTKITAPLAAYADDTAAGLAGLTAGQWYQTDGTDVAFPFAGVVKIKQ